MMKTALTWEFLNGAIDRMESPARKDGKYNLVIDRPIKNKKLLKRIKRLGLIQNS